MRNNILKAFTAAVGIVASILASNAEIRMTTVEAVQRYPWNGKVDISFTIESENPDADCKVTAECFDCTGQTNIMLKTIGHFNATEIPRRYFYFKPGRHTLTWDADADIPDSKYPNLKFVVKAEKANPHDLAKYLVIDVSGGASATSYPVTTLDEAPGGGWTDEHKTTKIVLRRCQAGRDPLGRYILTQDFYAGVFEVTQKQWALVMGSNPSRFKGNTRPVECVSYDMIRGTDKGAKWPTSSEVDATSFIGKLREKSGVQTLDLPTEGQWEYACRAGATTEFYTGNGESALSEAGWYYKGYPGQSHPVGQKTPNGFGLYDTHGNVEEWCLDWYDSKWPSGIDPSGAASNIWRVAKGGSWFLETYRCSLQRCRTNYWPNFDGSYAGFRIFMTVRHESKAVIVAAADSETVELNTMSLPCVNHLAGIDCPRIEPTYDTDGREAGKKCPRCGEYLEGGAVIPKLVLREMNIVARGFSGEYDGMGHGAEFAATDKIDGTALNGLGKKYAIGSNASDIPNGEWTQNVPMVTNAGIVYVWCELSAPGYKTATNSAAVTVTKAVNVWMVEPEIAGWIYGESALSPTGSAKFGETVFSFSPNPVGAPGNYEMTATVADTENYSGLLKTVSFTIVAPTPPTVEVMLDAMGGTIGGLGKKTMEMSDGVYGGLARPVREGYVFTGWFDGVGANAAEAEDGDDLLSDMAHALYARWENDPAVCDASIFAWEDVDAETVMITGFRDPDQKVEKLVIPDAIGGKHVVAIGEMAFANSQSGMKELYLPMFCLNIGAKAFLSVPTLRKIEFAAVRDWMNPASEAASQTIGEYAFAGATGLEELYLGEKAGAILDYAFLNARNLREVTILGKPDFGKHVFRSAGIDAGGVTVRLNPALAAEVEYLEKVSANMHNVTVKTDAVVRSVRTSALACSAKTVRMAVSVDQASSWGEVDASRLRVEYRETLSSSPVMLTPKAVKTDAGFVLEVEPPEASSGFFKVIVEE